MCDTSYTSMHSFIHRSLVSGSINKVKYNFFLRQSLHIILTDWLTGLTWLLIAICCLFVVNVVTETVVTCNQKTQQTRTVNEC